MLDPYARRLDGTATDASSGRQRTVLQFPRDPSGGGHLPFTQSCPATSACRAPSHMWCSPERSNVASKRSPCVGTEQV